MPENLQENKKIIYLIQNDLNHTHFLIMFFLVTAGTVLVDLGESKEHDFEQKRQFLFLPSSSLILN